MSSVGIEMPHPDEVNRAAETRARQWEDLCQRIDWSAVTEEFLSRLRTRLEPGSSPLWEHVVGALQDAPLADAQELDGWCRHTRLRVAEKLGRFLMQLYGEAQLKVMAQLDDRPF
jgi:hypothetical protein